MLENYLELLNQTFTEPNAVPTEKLKTLIEETMRLFREIREKFTSKDPKDREEAMQLSMEMKQALEAQMENISKVTGIDPSQFSSFSENFGSLSREEQALVEQIKTQFKDVSPEKTEVHHKNKMANAKIMG